MKKLMPLAFVISLSLVNLQPQTREGGCPTNEAGEQACAWAPGGLCIVGQSIIHNRYNVIGIEGPWFYPS